MKAEGAGHWEAGGGTGGTSGAEVFTGSAGVEDAEPEAVLTADVKAGGMVLFIFRDSNSGLEGAGVVPALVVGLGSRLMTGMAELEALDRGAVRRLLRVVVVVELVEEDWLDVEAGRETLSGCGAGVSRTLWILLMAALFSSSRSWTVTL